MPNLVLKNVNFVSLSRIARENLANYDDATIYHNDKNMLSLHQMYQGKTELSECTA